MIKSLERKLVAVAGALFAGSLLLVSQVGSSPSSLRQTPSTPSGADAGQSGSSGAVGALPTTAPTTTTLGEAPTVPMKDGWGVGLTPLPGSLVLDMDADAQMSGPGPWVALTFDDGPSKYTNEIMAILKRENVPATFFFLSENAVARPDDARAVKAAGFKVAAHTVSHRDLATLNREEAFDEINRSVDEINEIVGPGTVRCLRPPYGSYDDQVLHVAADRGLGVVNWDVDTYDWKKPGADTIRARAINTSKASIVLMHDGGGNREQTVAALPGIIADLKAKNSTFVEVC